MADEELPLRLRAENEAEAEGVEKHPGQGIHGEYGERYAVRQRR